MKTIARVTLMRFAATFGCLFMLCVAVHAAPVKVDILFMNHGPMQPVIKQIKEVLGRYPESVQAAWHDVETPEGGAFMKRMDIKGHIPLIIFVNGSTAQDLDGKRISFTGFPSGAGPFMFQGAWGMKDFDALLQSMTGKP